MAKKLKIEASILMQTFQANIKAKGGPVNSSFASSLIIILSRNNTLTGTAQTGGGGGGGGGRGGFSPFPPLFYCKKKNIIRT